MRPEGGAGGTAQLPGDYLYGDHREPYREAGRWGILRVLPADAEADDGLLHLDCRAAACGGGSNHLALYLGLAAAALVAGSAAAYAAFRRRRAA